MSDILWVDRHRQCRDLVHERRDDRLDRQLGNVGTSWQFKCKTPSEVVTRAGRETIAVRVVPLPETAD